MPRDASALWQLTPERRERARLLATVWSVCGLCSLGGAVYLTAALEGFPPLVPAAQAAMAGVFLLAGLYVTLALRALPLRLRPPRGSRAERVRAWEDLLAWPRRATTRVVIGGVAAVAANLLALLPFNPTASLALHGVVAGAMCVLLEALLLGPTLRAALLPALRDHHRATPGLRLDGARHGQEIQRAIASAMLAFGLVIAVLSAALALRWERVGDPLTLWLAALIGSAGLGMWAFTRVLLGPLLALTQGLERLDAGNLRWRAGVIGQGEIARFGEALDLALDRLESTRHDLHETERLLEYAQRLETTGLLTAGLLHDLNGPTATALLELELAAETAGDPLARDAIDGAQRALRQIHRMVEDHRVQHRNDPTAAWVTADEQLDMALRLAASALRPIHVRTDLGPETPAWVAPPVLARVTLNLLMNAAQALHARRDPRIELRARCVDGAIEVEVRDNGPGLPAEVVDRLFQAVITTKGTGTGLGLYVSRRLLVALGGSLDHDRRDAWTVFRARVPALPAARSGPD